MWLVLHLHQVYHPSNVVEIQKIVHVRLDPNWTPEPKQDRKNRVIQIDPHVEVDRRIFHCRIHQPGINMVWDGIYSGMEHSMG